MKYSNIRQRVNFYQAGNIIKTAAEIGLSAIPGVGEAMDIAGIIAGLSTGNFTQAALSALGLILPGVSGSSFKAGKEVVEAIGKENAQKIGKQLTKKLNPETQKIIKESFGLSFKDLKKIGQEIIDEIPDVNLEGIAKKLQKPPKDLQRILSLDQLKDPAVLGKLKLTKKEQDFLIQQLEKYNELSVESKKLLGTAYNQLKAATSSASERAATEAVDRYVKSGKSRAEIEQILFNADQKKIKAQKAKSLKAKRDKVLTSKSGVEFNAGTRFQGIPFYKDSDQLEKHIDVWLKHVEDEYLDLADDLVARGDLIKEGKQWRGRFGDKFKVVNPVDYVMVNSQAFKNAGLQFSGTTYRSGMTAHPYNQFVKNGGTGAPMGIWTTSNPRVSEYYSQYSQSGVKSGGVGHVIDIVGPKIGQVERLTGASSNSFDALGRTVADVTKDNPNALHVFSEYTDNLVPSAGPIKTVVYPPGTQVKSLQFNNGDFNMPALSPFRKKGGTINYYEYICN